MGGALSSARFEKLGANIHEGVAGYESRHPMRPGHPRSSLASSLEVANALLDAVIDHLADLTTDGGVVRSATFVPKLPAEDPAWEAAVDALSQSLAVPRASQLGDC